MMIQAHRAASAVRPVAVAYEKQQQASLNTRGLQCAHPAVPQFGSKVGPVTGVLAVLLGLWVGGDPKGAWNTTREFFSYTDTALEKTVETGKEFVEFNNSLLDNVADSDFTRALADAAEGFDIEIVDVDAPTGITYKGKKITKGKNITLHANIQTVVEKINDEDDTFTAVEKATGVPAELIGALWYRENSCVKDTDSPGGPFQFYPAAHFTEAKCLKLLNTYATGLTEAEQKKLARKGITDFKAAAMLAGCFVQQKMDLNNKPRLTPNSLLDELTTAAFYYNSKKYGKKEDSPYVYNLVNPKTLDYDPNRMLTIKGIVETDEGAKYVNKRDERPGVAPIIAGLQLMNTVANGDYKVGKQLSTLAESFIISAEGGEEGGTEEETSLGSFSSEKEGSELVESILGEGERFHSPVASITNAGAKSEFGYARSRLHNGLDCYGEAGSDIRAIADGQVIFAGWDPSGLGYTVKILHKSASGEPYVSIYGHCQKDFQVKLHQKVKAGTVIAAMGHSGNASSDNCIQHEKYGRNHVHVMIRLLQDGKLAKLFDKKQIAKHRNNGWVVVNPKALLP